MAQIISDCPFCEDLITEILLWLRVKQLLRFTSVCKQWHAIIKSPSFMRKLFHCERNHTRLLVYWRGWETNEKHYSHAFSLFHDETLKIHETADHVKPPRQTMALYGPCNGIFCLMSTCYEIALWNPATGNLRTLPSPLPVILCNKRIGFGIDPLTDELKIVLFQPVRSPSFAIYTSSNNTWRSFKSEALAERGSNYVSDNSCGNIFLNKFCYWKKSYMNMSCILAFDMHKEVFQLIDMPADINSRDANLVLYKNSLASFCYDRFRTEQNFLDLWVMKEHGCWTKLLTFFMPHNFYSLFGFESADKFLFSLHGDNEKLMVYDLVSGKTKNLIVPKRKYGGYGYISAINYKESLISA